MRRGAEEHRLLEVRSAEIDAALEGRFDKVELALEDDVLRVDTTREGAAAASYDAPHEPDRGQVDGAAHGDTRAQETPAPSEVSLEGVGGHDVVAAE